MSEERPNASMVFLPTELYMGLIKKMASSEIGKSAAILDSINEDLHNQGFISDSVYEKFHWQYSKRLVEVVAEKKQKPISHDPKTMQLKKTFVMVTEQWNSIPEKSRQYYVNKAKKSREIPEALEILRKAGVLNES